MPQRAAIWPSWRRADGDGVEEFLDLGQTRRRGDDGADAVAGEAVGLGEGVEVDEGVGPVGVGEQVVRAAGARLSKSR